MKLPVVFALLTALFWGLYGPVLGDSRSELKNAFKPYLLIGLAYLLWGVVGGAVGMWQTAKDFSFPASGTMYGFIAGTLGAFGALTLTLAMYTGGTAKPHIVMSIVFGGAVTITGLFSVLRHTGLSELHPLFWVGVVGIAVSIGLVATYTPHPAPPPKKPEASAAVPAVEPGDKPAAH